MVEISRKLNIVIPVDADAGAIYIHAMPIGREVFQKWGVLLAEVFSTIVNKGLGYTSGPRVAAVILQQLAETGGVWDGQAGAQNSLMNEIKRLSNVVLPGASGWTTVPLQDALHRKQITEEDWQEAEGALVFFTVVSVVLKRKQVAGWLTAAGDLWGFQTSLLNPTEFAASLPTSTQDENSGEKKAA